LWNATRQSVLQSKSIFAFGGTTEFVHVHFGIDADAPVVGLEQTLRRFPPGRCLIGDYHFSPSVDLFS
jgi:hypothetical protein